MVIGTSGKTVLFDNHPHYAGADARGDRRGGILDRVETLDRTALAACLMNFPSPTRLDFTHDYLHTLTTTQLRHLVRSAILFLRSR